jgi:hypothetical protein
VLRDGTEIPYELFLGVPVHRVPQVVVESGLAADPYGWVPVNKKTLETSFPGVYAVGDVNGVGTPKAGVFAEGAARVVAGAIIAQLRGGPSPDPYNGAGSCYVEFGHGQAGCVDVDFLSGPKPTGFFNAPSEALVAEKVDFGSSRLQRWLGARFLHEFETRSCAIAVGAAIYLGAVLGTVSTASGMGGEPRVLRTITLPLQVIIAWCFSTHVRRSSVSQFPSRTPSFFTPLTRRMPSATSGLSNPQSAAS